MALQAWFPLHGNLDNIGIASEAALVPSGGVSVSVSGKTGSCYSFDGVDDYLTLTGFTMSNMSQFSMAVWIKPTTADLSSLFLARNVVNQSSTFEVSIYVNRFRFRDTGNGSIRNVQFNTTISADTWTHIAAVYDKGSVFLYVNGQLTNSYIAPSEYALRTMNELRFGRIQSSTSNIWFSGLMNDIRIYDHSLSPQEVKELSQGLVLHYKLTENFQTLENVFTNPTFESTSPTAGWGHWCNESNSGTYLQTTTRQYIYYPNQTYCHKLSHTAGSGKYMCFQSPAFNGGYRSAQAIVKMSDGGNPTGDVYIAANSIVGTQPPNTYIPLTDGFWLIKWEGFRQSGENDLVGINVKNLKTVYISAFYLENDRRACSDILYNNDCVVDHSGYGNHGTVHGNLLSSTGSSRYENALWIRSGITDYITTPTILNTVDYITITMWVKSTNTSPTGNYHVPLSYSSYYEMLITRNGYFRAGMYVNGVREVYTDDIRPSLLDGKWHMISITFNGRVIGRYTDGHNYTYFSTPGALTPSPRFHIGKYGNSTTYGCVDMFVSDVRIYATALSERDMLDLYKTSATINNNGSINAFEFVENNVIPQIKKNGQMESMDFIEYDDEKLLFLDDGSIWLNILFHKKPATYLFTDSNCWNYDDGTNLYSAIHLLKGWDETNENGKFEFLAIEKPTASSTETLFRWEQSSNPSISSTVTGYSVISGNPSHTLGLLTNGNYGAIHNGNNCWNCCGAYTRYNGGIAGINSTITTGYLKLYVRIPKTNITGAESNVAAFYSGAVINNSIIEI